MNTPALPSLESVVKPFRFPSGNPHEYRVVSLRECPSPESLTLCETPNAASDYWRAHIATHDYYNPDVECLAVLLLNVRRRIRGHHLVSLGIQDAILTHPREVFRVAIAAGASAIIMAHNHPSGDPTPSAADINVTRELYRASQLLKIELLDHVIMGAGNSFNSLRARGDLNL